MVADDRGQLILVGAIAIALVLLGLVLIVNTALFTQVVGSEGTVETTKDGSLSGEAIGNAIGDVVATENRAGGGPTSISNRVNDNVTDHLQPTFANRTFESGGSVVSIDYITETETGTRTAQDSGGTFEAADGTDNWYPIELTESAPIESAFLTVYTNDSSLSDPFEMEVSDGASTMTITLSDAASGQVQIDVSGPSSTSCTVSPTANTIRIDVTNGHVYEDGSCTFDAFERLSSPDTVYFNRGDEIEGTYEIVSENPSLSIGGFRFDSSTDDTPTRTDAVLAFEYEFTYDSTAATVRSVRREVEVYD